MRYCSKGQQVLRSCGERTVLEFRGEEMEGRDQKEYMFQGCSVENHVREVWNFEEKVFPSPMKLSCFSVFFLF